MTTQAEALKKVREKINAMLAPSAPSDYLRGINAAVMTCLKAVDAALATVSGDAQPVATVSHETDGDGPLIAVQWHKEPSDGAKLYEHPAPTVSSDAQPVAPAVPEGFVPAPIVPTEAMCAAGNDANARYVRDVGDTYRIMLLAAPAPSVSEAQPREALSDLLVTLLISVDQKHNVYSDVQTHDNSFAEVAAGFSVIKAEIDRVFEERKSCPYYPVDRTAAKRKIIRKEQAAQRAACPAPDVRPSAMSDEELQQRLRKVSDIGCLTQVADDESQGYIVKLHELRALLSTQPAAPEKEENSIYLRAIADIRDLFPIPEQGSDLENIWASAMSDPGSVPGYVKACISQSVAPVQQPANVTLPERVIDTLLSTSLVSTYHPHGDQLEKLHSFAHGVTAEVLARLPAAPVQAAPVQEEPVAVTDETIARLWGAQRRYHGGEPCKVGHVEFARAILAQAAPAVPEATQPVAEILGVSMIRWLVDRDSIKAGTKLYPSTAPDVRPIDMILHCPKCSMQHIDDSEFPVDAVVIVRDESQFMGVRLDHPDGRPVWTNPPHRSHMCHGCGHIWRPADVPTNGVATIKTKGKADSLALDVRPSVPVGDEKVSWRYCDGVSTPIYPPAVQAAAVQQEPVAAQPQDIDKRECYSCGRPAHEHGWVDDHRGGKRRGNCPTTDKPQDAGQARGLAEAVDREAFAEMYGREPEIDGADWDWRGFRRGWVARGAHTAPAVPEGWRERLEEMDAASYTYSQYPDLAHAIFDSVINALDELERTTHPAPAVPPEWRKFVEDCSKTAGGMVNGNNLSILAGRLLAAAPSAPAGKGGKA